MDTRLLVVCLSLVFVLVSGGSSGCEDEGGSEHVWLVEAEPNDTMAEAGVVFLDSTVAGTMSAADMDVYLLEIPSDFDGYKVTISAADTEGDCFTGVDPNLTLWASDGVTMLDWVEDGVENYCPTLTFVPGRGEVYYVVVGTAYVLSGSYEMSITPGGPGTISGTVDHGVDQDTVTSRPPGPGAAMRACAPVKGRVVEGQVIVGPLPQGLDSGLGGRLSDWTGFPVAWVRPLVGGRYALVSFVLPTGIRSAGRQEVTRDLARRLGQNPEIGGAVANGIMHPAVEPGDEMYSSQWGLHAYPGVDAEAAWDLTQGDANVVVAVIDTGDDAGHPDLRDKSVPGFDFISDPDNAGDNDGVDPDPDDNLHDSHGVHVAGIVAAATDNGEGVAGVGWRTSYMPLRVCGNYGCTYADVMEAMGYAAGLATVAGPGLPEPRADVINLSLGANDRCPPPFQDIITAATYRGVVVVVAAGNGGEDAEVFSPANCQDVVAVGATGTEGERASFSNYGPTVDVYAPGDEILSTMYGGTYGLLRGTSMATPHVAGIVALLKALDSRHSTQSVLPLLTASCPSSGCTQPVDARSVLQQALSQDDPPPDLPELVLVKAVDVTDPARVFYTFARNGAFQITGIDPGTYRVEAGTDVDGDYLLGESGEQFGLEPQLVTITTLGEDVVGVQIHLSEIL